jgi:hypothetical protein
MTIRELPELAAKTPYITGKISCDYSKLDDTLRKLLDIAYVLADVAGSGTPLNDGIRPAYARLQKIPQNFSRQNVHSKNPR